MSKYAFDTVLIANRGEIACRIIQGCQALGYRAIAVYSEADARARHVQLADESVCLGAPPAKESYLVIEKLIAAAKQTGAQAIHPGYGFLAENADFAAKCAEAGLIFIGPPAEAIAAMGNKRAAKRRMKSANIPCVPGYDEADQSDARLMAEIKAIGFPVMIKAAAGGGGRGMRIVHDENNLAENIRTARSEAENAFGDAELILERALTSVRHVEIQVFADRAGNTVHLGERDCSVQRRHQKLIEESPSPAVNAELRAQMGECAVQVAKNIGYVGAGTVEFLLDHTGEFYFLEMNTRLQVEHPVTELVTGVDLVAWQLRIAAGENLPLSQENISLNGHAIEVRLCAEDPFNQFLPQTGTLHLWQTDPAVRTDHGIYSGWELSPFYDSMQAKIIAHGATRDLARQKLIRALEKTAFLGVTSNRGFLAEMLAHPAFASGDFHTGFIAQNFADLSSPTPNENTLAIAAALFIHMQAHDQNHPENLRHWHSSAPQLMPLVLQHHDTRHALNIKALNLNTYQINNSQIMIENHHNNHYKIRINDHYYAGFFIRTGNDLNTLYLSESRQTWCFNDVTYAPPVNQDDTGNNHVKAPMDGRIIAVKVAIGDHIKKGDVLLVLEAMKMETPLIARQDGEILELANLGQQVRGRQVVAKLGDAAK